MLKKSFRAPNLEEFLFIFLSEQDPQVNTTNM